MSHSEPKIRPFRSRVLGLILRPLRWIGIDIDLLIIVREGGMPVENSLSRSDYDFDALTPADVDQLIQLEPGTNPEQLQEWFQEGKLCFGLRDNSRLIAKTWCDLDEFYHPTKPYKLASDEVYLLQAYVDPDYRGQGLATVMRAKSYATLREMGRSKFLSYSRYFNSAARRFKAKLGAREEGLTIHLRLFRRWSKSLTFRY